ncbi:purine nucleoside phosphorylase [Theileria orientalis strain Shintoku]|uniref:Purine nucleoside phosphorylase n=1 Tax=Theileria orientalis strain Shintoku TaxID=869250 RepID=J4DP64_THEOR|nr:purine nucleoside phosphorylase [Theileria orientalis strain Shintoku]PVC51844.1 purine nucleoside phosphorylase [Theileria orientalis]BAM40164.1 purine nucleoside phosphorylase [Theileria orientalis strain Shintoku]|eukprot:XP_009690465.1 purine nucleoside phosphorylase [Theileria orientalis strain Shintoku]
MTKMEYKDCSILRNIGIPEDRIHKTAVICGNLGRFKVFARYGTKYKEYKKFSSYGAAELEVEGQMILIVCHGVSASSMGPILRELIEMGVKNIIRGGTCGTYKPKIHKAGDIFICYASIRDDTTSISEINVRYPAVADYDVIDALMDSSKELEIQTFVGIDYTSDLFYRRTCKYDHRDLFSDYGLVDTEDLELATLFVVSSLYGAKAGAILTVDGCPREWWSGNYHAGKEVVNEGVDKMARVALKAAAEINKKF